MSRIGNKTITIPAGVEVELKAGNEVTVKGPKGTLTRQFSELYEIEINGSEINVKRPNDSKKVKQLHGTTRSLIANMITGVSEGFTKSLELVGIGYRASKSDNKLVLNVGYSHPIEFELEDGVDIEVPSATAINITGVDKQRVGEWAANIRATRKPEPYLGKGIKYKNEVIRRKEGKTAAKK
ncbi:50S ribosomal protein L6 [Erysipelothrix rhusiopathiae]|uniref:Large ribosomal subunit protein uL6 n=2 Tax=Erysipelothrix TaxID=1647 RepID=E7FW40_ERYRH|nr:MULTISPECIES: 50S ribosomal protein L6 [Erysipelothrix]CAH2763092.1 50S ribosomal protein L6 [Erysipelothrix sp. A18Y020d]AMS10860.1 50S ribosomal protein L6 [Erysipelothrix rhusiopathiae]AOO66866.1 50S ribosomal protein L6 [Erysipelothrix rhusiopathiae]AWU41773.1 50S ribosomal protein L6 [Erysipelothrix rhusiopathiae]AYV34338.1 50S ribosomal protein L6 [Erysipelothrix rhusiopathiae]